VPSGTGNGGPTISVAIVRDPALVRTVRLVAAAVTRRAGQDEDLVEEVRLAVGEACALMIGESPNGDVDDRIEVTLSIAERLSVRVRTSGPVELEDPNTSTDGVQPWGLLRGLIDDFEVVRDGSTTTLAMSWPMAGDRA
jgi:anti-sigma regulatory factor (Ser/Thr protein kinase)